MADHLDAPGLMPPGGDPSIDITDVYAFQKPGSSRKSILMLNVNPLTLATSFNSKALYELKVDTNSDARADIAFKFKFSRFKDGRQTVDVRRAKGEHARGAENKGEKIIEHASVSFGSTPKIADSDGFKLFAGRRSDPFFFDLLGFLAGFQFTGSDFFIDKNVFGIALEVPNKAIGGGSPIGIWGRTLMPESNSDGEHGDDSDGDEEEDEDDDGGEHGKFVQIDRMGRPAINTVFNKGASKTEFNQTQPITDRAGFGAHFVDVLESFGYDPATATTIMEILLPDILTYDPASSAGFLNGRNLTDDVIDIELNLVTKGALTTDMVGPHTDLLTRFPFMGTPH